MLDHHQYLLPIYNGQPYSDKGPLMFWFFILGWKLTGIDYWWPQLLIGLVATASLFLTLKISEALWPNDNRLKTIIPFVLIGIPSWIVLSNEIRTDIFLLFFCLTAILALLKVYNGRSSYWILFGASLALGFLCKGPVILVYSFIPALLMPLILEKGDSIKLTSWYVLLSLSTLSAIIFALLWAIPAGIQGGNTFTHQIFFSQVYHRAFQDYSFFYYIIRIPLFFLPWILYAPFIIGGLKYSKLQNAERFCWLVIITSIVIFSFYGQKRVHYLDPDFPLLALIVAKAISNYMEINKLPKRSHQWFMSILFIGFASTILILPYLSLNWNLALQAQFLYLLKYNIIIALGLFVLAVFYFFYYPKTFLQQLSMITIPSAVLTTLLLILRVTN